MSDIFVLNTMRKLHKEYASLKNIDRQGAEIVYSEGIAKIFFADNLPRERSKYAYEMTLAIIESEPDNTNVNRWATTYIDVSSFLKHSWNVE